MARPQAADYDERKQAMLDCAARVFAKHGFHKASIGLIAKECNISNSLIYHYFSSKQEILFHAMKEHVLQLKAVAEDVLQQQLTPEENLDEILRNFMQIYEASAERHIVLLNELDSLPTGKRKIIVALQEDVIAIFSDHIAQLTTVDLERAGARTAVAMLLMGMINWTYTWYTPGGALSADTVAHLIRTIFVSGIRSLSEADFE